MGRGTLRRATREGEASKVKERFSGGYPKKVFALFEKSLFGEEPEKQSFAVPQDDGKTPSVCPMQRRPSQECTEHGIRQKIYGKPCPTAWSISIIDCRKGSLADWRYWIVLPAWHASHRWEGCGADELAAYRKVLNTLHNHAVPEKLSCGRESDA